MPFTVSHVAAVLPLRGRWLSSSALAIGAMAPDLPLFLPLPFGTDVTHTIFAMLVTNVLVGFALFVLWHGFFARPADWFAPSGVRARLARHQQPGLRRRLGTGSQVFAVVVSLYVGGVTHQVLDLFTHPGTVVTDRFEAFHVQVAGMPVYYGLQIVSSAVGLLVLAVWGRAWYRSTEPRPVHRQPSRLGKIAARATLVGGAAAATVAAGVMVGGAGSSAVFAMSVAPVAAVLVVGAGIAGLWHLQPR